MKQLRTVRFLTDRSSRKSGHDGELITPRHADDPTTFVRRLTYKVRQSTESARDELAASIAREQPRESAHFFVDTNMWDATLEDEVWDALIARGPDVVVIPQVRNELGNWLASHSGHRSARALMAHPCPFTLLDLPEPWSADWDAYAYYVSLLGIRRKITTVAASMFEAANGRPPSAAELVVHIQRLGGERALGLVYKNGRLVRPEPWINFTDESLVYFAALSALTSGRPSVILTKDQDVVEQFYKFCWFLDTHYRAALLAEEHSRDPLAYPILAFPDSVQAWNFFDRQDALLIERGTDRMNAVLPHSFDFVTVECWHVGRFLTRLVFGAERQMKKVIDVKGFTGGLVSDKLRGRNLHPWLPPVPLGRRIADSMAIVHDHAVPIVASNARLGLFDATHAINTNERFSSLRPSDVRVGSPKVTAGLWLLK
jgi:hypothetical protein